MSKDILDKSFKLPIQITKSIYSEHTMLLNLRQVNNWAARSSSSFSNIWRHVSANLNEEQYNLLAQPFDEIINDIKKYQTENKNHNTVKLNAFAKSLQKKINSTIGTGVTFTIASVVYNYATKMGNNQCYYTGFLNKFFGIEIEGNEQNIFNIISNSHYRSGSGMANHLIKLDDTNKPIEPVMSKALLGLSDVEAKWVELEANIREAFEYIEKQIKQYEGEKIKLDNSLSSALKKRLKKHYQLRRLYISDTKEAASKLIDLGKNHNDELKTIRDAFSAEISLKKPAEYWNDRARNSGIFAIGFGIVFVAISLCGIFIAYKIGPEMYKNLVSNSGDTPLSFVSMAIFTFPVIVFLWILKVFSRVFVENLHIHQESKHKHMIITTYLSMLQDPQAPIVPEERAFALKSIFEELKGTPNPIHVPLESIKDALKK